MSTTKITDAVKTIRATADDIRKKPDAELVELVYGNGNAGPAPIRASGRARRAVGKAAKASGIQSRAGRGTKAAKSVKTSGRSAPRKAVASKAVARKAAAKPVASSGNTTSATSDNEAKVRAAIKAGNHSMGAIMKHSGLGKNPATTALNHLRDRQEVFMSGVKRLARYAFSQSQQEADRQHQIAKTTPAAPAPRRTRSRSQPVATA